jgi:dienelactone hydrolase
VTADRLLAHGNRPKFPPALAWYRNDYLLVGTNTRRAEPIHLLPIGPGTPIDIGLGYLPRASPSGRWISYIDAENTLCLLSASLTSPISLDRSLPLPEASANTFLCGYAWAPDDRTIACAYHTPHTPTAPPADPIIDTDTRYVLPNATLALIDVETGESTPLLTLPALAWSGNIVWSPGSRFLYIDANRGHIYRVDTQTGTAEALTDRPHGDMIESLPGFVPVPTHDGTEAVVLSFDSAPIPGMWGHIGLALHSDDASALTPLLHKGLLTSPPLWSAAAQQIFATVKFGQASPLSQIYSLDLDGNLQQRTHDLSNAAIPTLSPDGTRLAYYWQDASGNDGLRWLDIATGTVQDIADYGTDYSPYTMGAVEIVHWQGSDGLALSGLLVKPPHYDPTQRYPLMVTLHGGPIGGVRLNGTTLLQKTSLEWHLWAAQSLLVFVPESCSSGAYGWECLAESHERSDLFQREAEDIEHALNALTQCESIDGTRLIALGHSYGATQAAYHITRYHRFRAAILYEGIYDWYAFCTRGGDTRSTDWMFHGKPHEAPERYLAASAICNAHNVTAAVLLVSGDGKRGMPLAPTRRFRDALTKNGIDTTLLVYPGEGHTIRKPDHQRDLLARTFAWLADRLDYPLNQ